EAKKELLEAYKARPSLRDAPVALARIESDAGNYQAALDYLIPVALTGRISADGRALLKTTFQKLHNSSDGLDAMLDAEYEKRYSNPIKIESYKPTAERSNRVVLTEIFSSASCPPCQAADLSLDAAMKRYARTDMIVMMYHLHVPRPDPMTNAATETRGEFYQVEQTPTTLIDGHIVAKGGGGREDAVEFYNDLYPKIDERLEAPARAQLRLDATQQGSLIKVHVTVDHINSPSNVLKLQIALVEDGLHYSGESSIRVHPMVVRSLASAETGGFDVDANEPKTVEYTFDVTKINAELQKYLEGYEKENGNTFWDRKLPLNVNNLSVVAFVQDTNPKSKQVLQAAFA
ncbi:MAG TPA: hypothetical protein VE821_01895, partial [Pyrinomonadaceae bacterium]|nr:hypothetical protein [Pyrinomonadaceae bacterium]